MKDLIIIGAGSVGGHIAVNYEDYNLPYRILGFVDDNPDKKGTEFCGFPVLGDLDYLYELKDVAVVVAIAFPNVKKNILEKLSNHSGVFYPTLVSSRAWVSKGCILGDGAIIYPGVCINYGNNIGDFVVINMNSSIGHDCIIGKHTSLAPNSSIGGHTHVGECVEFGIGACTKQGLFVCSGVILGGQAMVLNNILEEGTYVGIPARRVSEFHTYSVNSYAAK